jgi:hypothetical protein
MKNALTIPLLIFSILSAILLPVLSNGLKKSDLNTVTRVDLERVRGIGPSLASRILLERTRRGGFRTIEDLLKIRGISRQTLAHLEKHFYVRHEIKLEPQEIGSSDFSFYKPCSSIKEK